MAKKSNRKVFRLVSKETGEHYTIRLSREAKEKLSGEGMNKYSKKLRKHVEFKLGKEVKK